MNKRIVILALHLGTGGAEKVICNLANLLSEKNNVKIISTYKLADSPAFKINNNVEVEYLMDNLKPNKEEFKNSIKKCKIISIFKEAFKSLKILYMRRHLMINAIKNLDCDIAISTRVLHNKMLGKYGDKKIIKIAQEHNHHNYNQKYISKVINSLNNFDYFMPVSQELANFYNYKLKSENKQTKVIYIPNFIEKSTNTKSTLQSKQFISVGRLDKIKGFDDLIDIFDIFQTIHPDWTLHIVGDGSEKQNLQNKINKLNLQGKVILCGAKLQEDLENEYLNSSIYLMTSLSESFGIVLVEAASFGLPLIAFDSAQGSKEIIEDNKNGFLIPNRDKNLFVQKIDEIIQNPEKMKLFSDNSLKISNDFLKENVSKEWNKFIDNI